MSHQICVTISDELYKELDTIRKESGMPISRLIELEFKGYCIQKITENKK